MKVEVKESIKKAERDFPKLMVSDQNRIVFFIDRGEGVQLNSNIVFTEGTNLLAPQNYPHFTNIWRMTDFKDFEGEITLSND